MFLDQFENSVDNYRRMSRLEQQTRATGGPGLKGDADSIYSSATIEDDQHDETDTETEGRITPTLHAEGATGATGGKRGDRSSTALDTLTTELDALRSKWENTSRNYKLSDQFDFERGPSTGTAGRESLSTWARGFDGDEESIQSEESMERILESSPRAAMGNHAVGHAGNHAPTTSALPRAGPASTKA
jgi:hypothetical protein